MSGAAISERPPPLKTAGTVEEHQLYIQRPEDDIVYSLLREGTYCNILASRQVGKSSLVVRLRKRLQEQGIRVLSISLEGEGGNQPEDAQAWYKFVLMAIALEYDQSLDRFDQWWRDLPEGQPKAALVRAFVHNFLLHGDESIVVVIDEVDVTRTLPFTDDFFLALRALHNDRSKHPELARITFCLVGVLLTSDLIKATTATPYNIGTTVRLHDFSREHCDLSPLDEFLTAQGLDGPALLDEVLSWSSGQPFLTIGLCDKLVRASDRSVEQLVREEVSNPVSWAVHFERVEHLVRKRISKDSKVREPYLRMLRGRPAQGVAERDEELLMLAGLVRRDSEGRLLLRNRIYQHRFDRRWVARVLPAPPVPRWLLAVIVMLVGALASVLGVWLWQRYQDELERQQRAQRDETELAVARVNILMAPDDRAAQEIWNKQISKRTGPADKRLVNAARTYWTQANSRLQNLAREFEKGGCPEEAYLVDAFIAARRGAAMPKLDGLALHTHAIEWLPQQMSKGSEIERCLARRKKSCDRLTPQHTSDPQDAIVTASCEGQMLRFRPGFGVNTLDAEIGQLAVPLPAAGVKAGTGQKTVPLPASAGTFRAVSIDKDRTALLFSRLKSPVRVRPCLLGKRIIALEVTEHENKVGIAYLCSNKHYGALLTKDLEGWLSTARNGRVRWPKSGMGVDALVWLDGRLVLALPGERGKLMSGGASARLPHVTFLAGVPTQTAQTAFTTRTPLGIGTLRFNGNRIEVQHAAPSAKAQAKNIAPCEAQSCEVLRLAVGPGDEQVAAQIIDYDEKNRSIGARLVMSNGKATRVIPLSSQSPTGLAMMKWRDAQTAVVAEMGRLRFITAEPEPPTSWEEVQRRMGMTIEGGDGGAPRIMTLEESELQPVKAFATVFAEEKSGS